MDFTPPIYAPNKSPTKIYTMNELPYYSSQTMIDGEGHPYNSPSVPSYYLSPEMGLSQIVSEVDMRPDETNVQNTSPLLRDQTIYSDNNNRFNSHAVPENFENSGIGIAQPPHGQNRKPDQTEATEIFPYFSAQMLISPTRHLSNPLAVTSSYETPAARMPSRDHEAGNQSNQTVIMDWSPLFNCEIIRSNQEHLPNLLCRSNSHGISGADMPQLDHKADSQSNQTIIINWFRFLKCEATRASRGHQPNLLCRPSTYRVSGANIPSPDHKAGNQSTQTITMYWFRIFNCETIRSSQGHLLNLLCRPSTYQISGAGMLPQDDKGGNQSNQTHVMNWSPLFNCETIRSSQEHPPNLLCRPNSHSISGAGGQSSQTTIINWFQFLNCEATRASRGHPSNVLCRPSTYRISETGMAQPDHNAGNQSNQIIAMNSFFK